jgi:DNA replication protein DnaC
MQGEPFHGLRPSDLRCWSVPVRYAAARLSPLPGASPEQQEALTAALAMVDRYAAGRPSSMVLLGSPGVGKSHIAAATCHAMAVLDAGRWRLAKNSANLAHATRGSYLPTAAHQPPQPVWVNVPSLVVDLKAEMGAEPSDQERTTFARRLRGCPSLVVLDDLGRERISEWTGELLYVVVNDRYEAGLPTIATSNLTVEELVASGYWPAISRLAEDGRIVEVKGRDNRLRKGAA